MEPRVEADRQGQVEDINILAVWDGILGHAVEVNICAKVNSRPGTRQVLINRSDDLVDDASVTEIRQLNPPSAGIGTQCEPQKPDQPSSPSPPSRIPVIQQPFRNWNLKTPEKHRLAKFYRDITSAKSFTAVAAAERWQEIKEADPSDSSVMCYPNTDDGYAQLDIINSQLDQTTSDDTLASVGAARVSSATSSVGCSLESSSISDCSSKLGFNIRNRRSRVPQGTWRRSRYASEIFAYEGMEDLRTRIANGQPVRVRNALPKAIPVSKAPPNTPTKKPWIPPALSDLSSQSKITGSPNFGTKPVKSQTSETSGTRDKNPLDLSSPRKHISCRQPPYCTSEHAHENAGTGHNEIKNSDENCAENQKSCVELANLNIIQRQSEPVENIGLGATDFADAAYRRCSTRSASISPPESPRRWLRHRRANTQRSNYFPLTSLGGMSVPTWIIEDEKLWIVFPENARPGTFEIDIKAKIRLSFPISPYRHSFSIPGLIQADVTQNPIPTGSFAFFVELEKWIPHTQEVRLGSGNLLDWRIKKSSHAIGNFRLDTSPKLSIRIKAPLLHVLDFSAVVEMSTCVVPMTEHEVGLRHRVKIISEISEDDIFADRVELFLVVRNGLLEDVEYHTEIGTCTVLHESVLGPTGKKDNEALLRISRDLKDLRTEIDLNFIVSYRLGSGITPYPTVRPLFGNVVSETIFITCPKLPLTLEHVPQVQLSSWEALRYNEPKHAVIRLDRVQMPKFFPQGLRDDPLIRISELSRVSFRSLGSPGDAMITENPACVARDLRFTLHEICSGEISCRIEVDVEVGQNDGVLVIDPRGWNPCYSLIGDQLATEQRGQWRVTTYDYLTLFKTDSMKPGNIVHVVFQFQRETRPDISEETDGNALSSSFGSKAATYELPKIIGKTALGTVIKSDLEQCTVHLVGQPGYKELSQTLNRTSLSKMHLPRLTPNYHLSIGYTKSSGDIGPRKPVIEPSKRGKRSSSSSELGSTLLQPDHQGTNTVQFANTKTTHEPLVTETRAKSDDTKVPETGASCVATDTPNKVLTDASSTTTLTESALTTAEEEILDTTGHLSWASIIVIALGIYLTCMYFETGLSALAPSRNDSAGTEFATGLSSSLYGSAECSEGRPMDSKCIPGDSYEESVDAIPAPSESVSDAADRDEMQLRHRELSVLDMIDRALGWKGQ